MIRIVFARILRPDLSGTLFLKIVLANEMDFQKKVGAEGG